jgi:Tfp pilus assembly protein FimV
VAEKASKAVPAMAVAGVLVAAPHATTAAKVPVSSAVIVEQAHTGALAGLNEPARRYTVRSGGTLSAVTDALVVHHEPARRYTVRPGDTLSSSAAVLRPRGRLALALPGQQIRGARPGHDLPR